LQELSLKYSILPLIIADRGRKIPFNQHSRRRTHPRTIKSKKEINSPTTNEPNCIIQQKRIQKMHRTVSITRAEKKEEERLEKERINELKKEEPQRYLQNLYQKRKDILQKIEDRNKKKQELTSRKNRIFQRRMQIIAELGYENEKVLIYLFRLSFFSFFLYLFFSFF